MLNSFMGGGKYSTYEQVVGEWIDGKPIYQKVVESVVPTVTATGEADTNVDLSSLNIDLLLYCQGSSKTVQTVPLSTYFVPASEEKYTQCFYNTSNKNLYIRNSRFTTDNGKTVYVILIYTKTTDQPSN